MPISVVNVILFKTIIQGIHVLTLNSGFNGCKFILIRVCLFLEFITTTCLQSKPSFFKSHSPPSLLPCLQGLPIPTALSVFRLRRVIIMQSDEQQTSLLSRENDVRWSRIGCFYLLIKQLQFLAKIFTPL